MSRPDGVVRQTGVIQELQKLALNDYVYKRIIFTLHYVRL